MRGHRLGVAGCERSARFSCLCVVVAVVSFLKSCEQLRVSFYAPTCITRSFKGVECGTNRTRIVDGAFSARGWQGRGRKVAQRPVARGRKVINGSG